MNFDEYQKLSRETAIYPRQGNNFIYPTLGLVGETGEVADKISKVIRDQDEKMSETTRQELKKELGDVLWYLSNLAAELNLTLTEIAEANLEKLNSRKERGMLFGNGDNR